MNSRIFDKCLAYSIEKFDLEGAAQQHFSFIIKKNTIVSYGINFRDKTNPLAIKYGYYEGYIHSELHSIIRFPYRPAKLKDCVLINIRLNRKFVPLLAAPCDFCKKLLAAFQPKEIYYSNNKGYFDLL